MKKMKKTLALVLALVMALALAIPAVAADPANTVDITVASTDTHSYKVFQVLKGTLASEGATELGNPAWGSDATNNEGTTVAQFIAALDGKSEAELAAYVANFVNLDSNGRGTVSKSTSLRGQETGYYLLYDVTNPLADGDSLSLHLVKVLNSIEIAPKNGTVTPDKKITADTLDKKDNSINDDVTNNVSIGDTVTYEISGTVPALAVNYDYYFFIMNDTLSEGLTFDSSSVKVYKDSIGSDNLLTAGTDYKLYTGTDATDNTTYADGKTFQIALTNAIAHAGEKIIVTYNATLNDKAKIGEDANENTFKITYSNDPNHTYNGDKDNDTPGKPDKTKTVPTHDTVEKTTETYATGIQIQKVDEKGNVLTGAEFTLTGENVQIVLVSEESFVLESVYNEGKPDAEQLTATHYKLTNGNYTTEAPVSADRMDKQPAGTTSGYVIDNSYDGDDKVVIGDTTYRPYKAEDGATDVYKLIESNLDLYASDSKDGPAYVKTVTYTQKNTKATPSVPATMTVGADGIVTFTGLGSGTYTITESATPAGYNTIDPIVVTIAFDKDGDPHWSVYPPDGESDATYNPTSGLFEIQIENNKGSTLPETGGIGTKIFYALGAVLVVGAGVVLVSRKRVTE